MAVIKINEDNWKISFIDWSQLFLYQFFLMFILINQLAIDFIDCYLMLLFLEPGPGRGGGGDNATCLGKFMVASIP